MDPWRNFYEEVRTVKDMDIKEDLREGEEHTLESIKRALAAIARRKKRLLYLTIAALVLCAAALAAALCSTNSRQREMQQRLDLQNEILASMERELDDANSRIQAAEPVITSETVRESVNSLRELITKEYLYTNAGKYESHNEVSISSITVGVPLTRKSFTVVYDGRIKAGIDLSKIRIDVSETLRSITVTLPSSEITSHEIFENTVQCVDERDALFNKNTIDDYNDFLAQQKTAMEERVRANGFLSSADQEARALVESFLSLLPGMDAYRLTVK